MFHAVTIGERNYRASLMHAPLHGRDADIARLVRAGSGDGHVLVAGPRGVGRTALLREVARRLADGGRRVDLLTGSRATRSSPLAAMAPLLPAVDVDQDLLVAATVRLLAADADRRCVVIDDAHLLDDQSLGVVAAAAARPAPSLLLGAADHDVPAALERLVADGQCTTVTLSPLEDCAPLLAAVGMDGVPREGLHELTGGLPRLVTAWVEDRAAGDVAPDAPVSRVGPSFVTAVRDHLGHLAPELIAALEIVAVGEPLALDAAEDLLGGLLDELETRAAAEIDTGAAAPAVRVTGPGVGVGLRTGLGHVRGRSLRRRVDRALLAAGSVPTGARSAAAERLMAADGRPPASQLVAAAADARDAGQPGRALELAHAALDAGAGPAARRVLGDVLAVLGHPNEAERVLADTMAVTADPATVRIRARNLAYGLEAPDRALEVLRGAAPVDTAGQLLADRTLYATMLGDRSQVLTTTDRLLEMDVPPPVRLTALVHRTLVDALAGATEDAARRLPAAERLADDLVAQAPTTRAQVTTNRMLTLVGQARIDEACTLATQAATAAAGGPAQLLADTNEAYVRHLAGDLTGGIAALDRAAAAAADPFGLRGSQAALRVRLTADAGLLDTTAADIVRSTPAATAPRVVLTDAWARAVLALHDRGDACRVVADLREAARRLDEAAHHVWAAELLYLAVRRDHAAAVVEDLERIAAGTPGSRYVDLLARHGRAAVEQDHTRLLQVARDLAAGGAVLFAAEAAADATAAAPAGRAATRRAATVAAALRRDLRGAATPTAVVAEEALTERELDVARLAPAHSSREVAATLHIATRTVDNHLHAVYRKLDLAGREDLAALLGPAAHRLRGGAPGAG